MPPLDECVTPLRLFKSHAPLRPFFSSILSEFRDTHLQWHDIIPLLGHDSPNPLQMDVSVWPLVKVMHHGGGMVLRRRPFTHPLDGDHSDRDSAAHYTQTETNPHTRSTSLTRYAPERCHGYMNSSRTAPHRTAPHRTAPHLTPCFQPLSMRTLLSPYAPELRKHQSKNDAFVISLRATQKGSLFASTLPALCQHFASTLPSLSCKSARSIAKPVSLYCNSTIHT